MTDLPCKGTLPGKHYFTVYEATTYTSEAMHPAPSDAENTVIEVIGADVATPHGRLRGPTDAEAAELDRAWKAANLPALQFPMPIDSWEPYVLALQKSNCKIPLAPIVRDERRIRSMGRQRARKAHHAALLAAIDQGSVTLLDPWTRVRLTARSTIQIERSLISRSDLINFAASLGIQFIDQISTIPTADIIRPLASAPDPTKAADPQPEATQLMTRRKGRRKKIPDPFQDQANQVAIEHYNETNTDPTEPDIVSRLAKKFECAPRTVQSRIQSEGTDTAPGADIVMHNVRAALKEHKCDK